MVNVLKEYIEYVFVRITLTSIYLHKLQIPQLQSKSSSVNTTFMLYDFGEFFSMENIVKQ